MNDFRSLSHTTWDCKLCSAAHKWSPWSNGEGEAKHIILDVDDVTQVPKQSQVSKRTWPETRCARKFKAFLKTGTFS